MSLASLFPLLALVGREICVARSVLAICSIHPRRGRLNDIFDGLYVRQSYHEMSGN
jgi:hypothetical protein